MHDRPLWQPDAAWIARTRLAAFQRQLAGRHGVHLPDYAALHRWSVDNAPLFWRALWDFAGVVGEPGARVLVDVGRMPGAQWFPDARLNFAENLLRFCNETPDREAIVFRGELEVRRRLSYAELHREVARLAAALRDAGVKPGDRVAAYMPNMPETVIAMLASAAIGAIFSSASPDFGVQGVLDRFGQIEPVVLIAADGALYADKRIDALSRLAEIVDGLPSVREVVVVPYIHAQHDLRGIRAAKMWGDFVEPCHDAVRIDFTPLPFGHPLYILYSSGTTGVPKCIVHSAGGTLLQHIKELQLHADVQAGDRLFYYTTCGWMMWNWLASSLSSGATLMLYDGSPFAGHHGQVLWDYCRDEQFTHFGTSAKFIDAAHKLGHRPVETHVLSALRGILSTGSPLSHEGFDYVYRDVKPNVCLSSISGGTDIVSCFVLGNPAGPVWRGEIQAKGLGMAVEVFDDDGHPVHAGKGELVCTKPFPAMPIGFWNDPDGARYRAAYFERFPGVWCHGDWCEETEHGGLIIHGRSDATLNPGGVRIGTAEIYRQVEKLDEVLESVVIGQDWEHDVRVVLFVRLRDGLQLDEGIEARIRKVIRDNASPRHVPARIVQVADIPRTKSGKIVELAVRAMVHGQPVRNVESLANPEALAQFRDRPELAD
ncbi:acetoacetate--CoA ligase [Uliginosibacterium sp. H1]|uniref:acetoacetate--CoA ligase n=1 Tax=Uliginosibacterium sp. H1 TaxID=3114757 RepID=UPI002E197254|nr:acetoacetate--CoA ligase [Uliginosibacterium sp. H1]